MTLHVSPASCRIEAADLPDRSRMRTWSGAVAVVGLFLMARPYQGIVHDSFLYVGRALANLDPQGLGLDISFATDGQSAYSLYPRALTLVTAQVGPASAAMIATAIGLTLWLVALVSLVRSIAPDYARLAALACVVIAPASYDCFEIFRYGEPFAAPRNLGEAGILCGLAALASGRRWLALAIMLLAALIHPIMAAPGLAVWLVLLCVSDRRWGILVTGSAALLPVAAALGVPLAERLFATYDPAWREAIDIDAYLFPSQWPALGWQRLAVNAATVALGIQVVRGPGRPVLAAILVVGLGGVLVTWLVGDVAGIVLVVQAQPWRALWLVTLAAALVLPLVARDLWGRGPAGHAVLAMLALAWIEPSLGACAIAAGATILVIAKRRPDVVGRHLAIAAGLMAAVVALTSAYVYARGLFDIVMAMPPGGHVPHTAIWRTQLGLPFGIAVVAWFVAGGRRIATPAIATGALLLCAFALAMIDDRPEAVAFLDRGVPDPALTSLLPPEPAEILVLDEPKISWFLFGRRDWASRAQSAGMVFSRPLAVTWLDRMQKLARWNLGYGPDQASWIDPVERDELRPSLTDLKAVCEEPKGPSMLIVPLPGHVILPDGLDRTVWTLPRPFIAFSGGPSRPWITIDRFALIDCATLR